jgi:hypothetical protein
MLVTFKTDFHADITMFGDVALSMLKMMGHSGTIPSAILAANVPQALSRLMNAIDQENSPPALDESDADQQTISMCQRARPLISLFSAAVKSKSNVMWE